ncbi:hypothetical protein OK074_5016 [Actinobacteria bacterium OK074]|nr:hypothetical protein OK074_5016 [Actinobacteria bacterium OK074]
MRRPADMSDDDWIEYQELEDDHNDLMAQCADREAQMENGLNDSYDEYEFDFSPLPPKESSPPPSASPRSSEPRRHR